MKKRLLSVLLALVMVLGFMPTIAFADDGETEKTFYLDNGSITIEAQSDGKQYVTQVNGVTNEEQTGKIVITQSSTAATTNTITIEAAENRTAHVTFSGVNIDVSGQDGSAAVSASGEGNVVVELNGTNTVKSGLSRAGLEKNNDGSLTITDADNTGSLNATGGWGGAGIGGIDGDETSDVGNVSNITITGGTVTAMGGGDGSGIGGGNQGSGSYIKITGGTVTAIGGINGAGIGGGWREVGEHIAITGGSVTAKGGAGAAGIGGGSYKDGSDITISGNAQIKVQGGNGYTQNGFKYGAGAPIGNGSGWNGVDGAKVDPDVSKLTTKGKIKYYAPGVDMATAAPTTFTGTACSHILVKYDAKTATCTETGNMEYWHCSVCEKNFTSEACDTEIADVETEKNASNHSGTAVWTQTATTHKQVYSCCQVVNVAETNHTWQDGKCTVCNYPCTHSGGKAYCTAKAVCEICNQEYGNTDPSNHSGALEWVQTAKTHKQIYNCCNAVNVAEANHTWENGKCTVCKYVCQHTDTDKNHICDICGKTLSDHTGGKATCTKKAVCDYCGKEYGETDPNNHSGTAVWTQTATTHEQTWDCCNAIIIASEPHEWENGKCSECGYACLHSGGKATCKDKAVCVVCNEEYGDLAPHELTHKDAKPATAAEFGNTEYWYCSVCDRYFSDENAENEIEPTDTVIAKIAPKIIAGDGATVTQGEKKALSFTSDAAFDDFIRVEIDGVTLYEANYTVKEGSIVITLNVDYVATLAVGEHTLGIVSESGTAEAKFTVNKKAEETTAETTTPSNEAETAKAVKAYNKTSPHTGGGNNLALWIALLFVSGGAVALTMFASKKKRYNK